MNKKKICNVDQCNEFAQTRGLCSKHYAQTRRGKKLPMDAIVTKGMFSEVKYKGIQNNIGIRLGQVQRERQDGRTKMEIANEIAEYCGVASSTIVRIYRGEKLPSFHLALKIAKYFDCSVNDIFKLIE